MLLGLTLLAAAPLAPGALAAAPRASFNEIENEVMCVACHESLAVAQSPEAFSERQYIRTLIAQGDTRKQILNALVASYTTAVLAVPPAHGFSILVYIIPPVAVALALAFLVFTLPRWRRRSRAAAAQSPPPSVALDPVDAQRLEAELARNP
jgi:cytochrome c-type biogenesis protein CcmH